MQKKFLFVINPISGGTDKAPIENSIDQWVKENTLNATKYFTQGENDRDKIENYLNAESFTHLIGVGGDGTIVLVAGLAKKHNLPMGMIPAGSANGFATQLKIPSNTKQALKIILEAEEKSIDTLLFNQERLGLHISDLGLNAQLVEHFEET
jgi:diacylglycerol kinase (ATP)